MELLTRYGSDEDEAKIPRQARRRRLAGSQGPNEEAHPRDGGAADPDRGRAGQGGAVFTLPDGAYKEFFTRFPYEETEDQLTPSTPCSTTWPTASRWTGSSAATSASARQRWRCVRPSSRRCQESRSRCRANDAARAAAFPHFHGALPRPPGEGRPGSRLVPAKEKSRPRRAERRADRIVVGTHAARQGRRVQDLGLLVIDEEQHFGVAHKERLKKRKTRSTCSPSPRPRFRAPCSWRSPACASSAFDRDAPGRPAGDPHLRQRVRRDHRARGAAARALPRRAGVLRGARGSRTCPRSRRSCASRCRGGQLRGRPRPDGGAPARRAG